MTEATFAIPNISCNHCVLAIQNELSEAAGVNAVIGDAAAKTITVRWSAPMTEARIRQLLQSINYKAD